MKLNYAERIDLGRICDKEPLKAVEIMTFIAEELGSVTMSEFADIAVMNKRTVERQCKSGKILVDEYFKRPMINIHLRKKRGEI